MDLTVNGQALGVGTSEVALPGPGRVTLAARVGCLLPERAPDTPPDPSRVPYWTPEHARRGRSREVDLEVIVNGRVAATHAVAADGGLRPVTMDVEVGRSSWVALRIRGCAHTNPMFVIVAGRPVRASRRSAEWCLGAVDQCWSQKGPKIRTREREAASQAYEHARAQYKRIAAESDAE
jgi:hypothetical protein